MNNYKWKPTDHLTIDFKIEYVKEMTTGKLDYKYFDNKKIGIEGIGTPKNESDRECLIITTKKYRLY